MPSDEERIACYRDALEALASGGAFDEVPEGHDPLGHLGERLNALGRTLRRRFDELAQVQQITEEINAGLLLPEVLDHVYEGFKPLIPYDRIGCALLLAGGGTLRAVWCRADYEQRWVYVGYTAPLAGSSLQRILETGNPRIINDLEAYLREKPESLSTRRIVREGIRSNLTCPLIAEGAPIGFLFFSSREPGTYTEEHVEALMRVARQLSIVVEKSHLYEQVLEEQRRSERLLHNVLPSSIADRLRDWRGGAGRPAIADSFDAVTVLFSDLVGFTPLAAELPPDELVALLNRLFSRFDAAAREEGVEKIKTIGDAYMAVSGAPDPAGDHAERVARLALRMLAALEEEPRLTMRIGIHSGPVVAGVIGQSRFVYDLWGDTVNVASRMESHGQEGRIQVSAATEGLLRARFRLEPRGTIRLKGHGGMPAFFLLGEA